MNDLHTKPAISLRPAKHDDISAITNLLATVSLPLEGIEECIDDFFVAEDGGVVIGCAGFETHGAAALVRSVAVSPDYRGQKIAEKLYGELVRIAREKGLREFVLLTTDASPYFARFGFKIVSRDDIDPDLLESDQFKKICPSTAICMRIALGCKPIGAQLGIGVKR